MSSTVVQQDDAATTLEVYLDGLMSREAGRGAPDRLVAAMRHAVLGGGKRFRPQLVVNTALLFGVPPSRALPAASAIELIHCYSLVHDDLPSMDNDEIRRGQPTVWKAFDEWTAILAGDALQSLAFELLASPECHENAKIRASLVATLAAASGAAGMVGGQVLDLEAGRNAQSSNADHIMRLQAMKTGRLIKAACEMGAILGEATETERTALGTFGDRLGYAFQISDDLLDAEGHATTVGKATGKDAAAGKATLVALLGRDGARRQLDAAITEAVAALEPFGARAEKLIAAARLMGRRTH